MYSDQLQVAIDAAAAAAEVIREHSGRLVDGDIRAKGVHDLVTIVDVEAQKVVVETLNAGCPGYEILAEEDRVEDWNEVAREFRWIIDPIDGTTNFIHGLSPYAVSIGLQHKAEMVVAVVLEVTSDSLFTATKDGGAFANSEPIRVSRRTEMHECLLTTGFPYRSFDNMAGYLATMEKLMRESRGIRRPGSASVDLAYVAAGVFDGFFESGLEPWDVAAGVLLIKEAGGKCSDFHGNGEAIFAGQILASNGLIHEQLVESVAPMRV